MLGGGTFTTQDKTLPGAYINVINASKAKNGIGDRGSVAIALALNKSAKSVIELNAFDFNTRCKELLGFERDSANALPLRELFRHATKVYIFDLGGDGTVQEALDALESYDFNVLCAYTTEAEDITTYVNGVKNWRDKLGKKCQLVAYKATSPDHEGVINVKSELVSGEHPEALAAWVAGAEAACPLNQSITNMLYDGELKVKTNVTQSALEANLAAGEFVFNLVYGEVRVLEDINSLTTTTPTKGDDFKYNQTIRVIDQIANDIARLFNTKYLGRIPNNKTGRVSLWGDIVGHHRKLEQLDVIEDYDSSNLRVEPGDSKRAVVVYDLIKIVNAMDQLYMTLVIR